MPRTRRNVYLAIGSALCLGALLVFYAAAHQWLPLLLKPSAALGHRPNLALIALFGVVSLAAGVSFLTRALLPQTANQRTIGMVLGVTLCVTSAIALVYTAQGWAGSLSRNDAAVYILAWAVLGIVSLVVLFAGARTLYDLTRGGRGQTRAGARHTPQGMF
jgi:uncharacterized membrane protein YidH (DUF202 family)